MKTLSQEGHTAYAMDFIGHGMSDRILDSKKLTVEMQADALHELIEYVARQHPNRKSLTVGLHDWGGCVFSLAQQKLPNGIVTSTFWLNSFLPPRAPNSSFLERGQEELQGEISLNQYLLYTLWFFTIGILGPYTPETLVMRYMVPSISRRALQGFTSAYEHQSVIHKASIVRFAHAVPGLPRPIYKFSDTTSWKTLEGLMGPERFDNLHQQVRLARADVTVRKHLKSRVAYRASLVICGRGDTLLSDLSKAIFRTLEQNPASNVRALSKAPKWIEGAGHYPLEEKPEEINEWLLSLIRADLEGG